jgi:glc operon protein GlcG
MRVRYSLTLGEAETMVSAAQRHARAGNWPVTVAIVDDSGAPILVSRSDDATPASVATAIEKARSAALTGLPTKTLEALVKERPAVATLGRVAVEGGLPILFQGQRVGGVGVSGVRSDQDTLIAEAALQALDLRAPP